MTSSIFAVTKLGLPVIAHHFQSPKKTPAPKVLILGGVHGDEKEGVIAASALFKEFTKQFPYHLDLTLIPAFNPDGVTHNSRTNYNGVDLNRNLPTKDWSPEIKTPRYHPGPAANSEAENQALSSWIETNKPKFILSLHSWHPVLNVNGQCLEEAQKLSELTGYKIDTDIGYPTPGCLGTFAGLERNCPTLTYEIERGLIATEILKIHVPAILQTLKVTEQKHA